MTAAYPLQWPNNIPRAKAREKGQFRTTLQGALNNVTGSIHAFGRDSGKGIGNLILSSNVTLGNNKPSDPGVACWFTWDGMQVCIPVDRYSSVEANLQAIHHIIEARRTELRHGTLALVRATFTGFLALPPANDLNRPWHEVFGFKAMTSQLTREAIEKRFRELSKTRHPDTATGSNEAFAELTRAREDALREVSQ